MSTALDAPGIVVEYGVKGGLALALVSKALDAVGRFVKYRLGNELIEARVVFAFVNSCSSRTY